MPHGFSMMFEELSIALEAWAVRSWHKFTLLPNSEALVAGGESTLKCHWPPRHCSIRVEAFS
jgi:hypothetical protein